MDEKQIADLEAAAASAKQAAEAAGGKDEALNKAHKDAEDALAKAKTAPSQKNEKRDAVEKAKRALYFQVQEVKKLGGDPTEVIKEIVGDETHIDDSLPDDKPLTMRDLRNIQKSDARKTAVQMAEALTDDVERDAVLKELAYIVPSGNAEADFRRAQASANAERNAKIAEMAAGKGAPRRTAAGASQPAKTEETFEPTPEELATVRGFNFSPARQKEIILKARKDREAKTA